MFLLMIIIVIILCLLLLANIIYIFHKKYKVNMFLCILTRSLKYTYDSINKNILNELKN